MSLSGRDDAMKGLLDRLVCDELSTNDRSCVLRWLDADPLRWRRCALLFLEAQVWRKALRDAPPLQPVAAVKATGTKRRSRTSLSIAALVLAAFVGGWNGAAWLKGGLAPHDLTSVPAMPSSSASSDSTTDSQTAQPMFASFPLVGLDSKSRPRELKVPVDRSEFVAPTSDTVISDYERKKLERRGLRVSKVREYVPGKLPDGTDVLMSVDRLRVERIGVPTI